MPKDHGIGASEKRREDVRFLTGKGRYTDDINLPGQAYVAFLRSDVAHGRLVSVDTSEAEAMPGVLHVFTGKDFESVGGLPCGWQITGRDGEVMKEPKHPVLAHGKVRHVGDPIAAVVAETPWQARDAADAIMPEIEDLPAVMDMKAAMTRMAQRWSTTTSAPTSATTGASSRTTARRSTRRSATPTTSPRWSWSTTG